MQTYEMSERQACRLMSLSRSVLRYEARSTDDHELAQELLGLAERQPRWGCSKMVDYLRNQGHSWNHKRIRRMYRTLQLNLRRKPKKRLPARTARALAVPEQSNQSWSLDFMSDSLSNGRAFRTLNILDDYNREALWIEVDTSIPAERVIRVLEVLLLWRGTPHRTGTHPTWKTCPKRLYRTLQSDLPRRSFRCLFVRRLTGGACHHRTLVAGIQYRPPA